MRDWARFLHRGCAAASASVCRRFGGFPAPAEAASPLASSLWSWGRGVEGALGDGSGGDTQAAQHTGESWESSSANVYAGMWHSGAVVDGAVLVWGKGTSGRLGLGDDASSFQPSEVPLPGPAVSLSLGGQHSLTLVRASDSEDRDTGAVASASDDAFEPYQLYSWGMGDYGCLGLCHLSSSNVPAEVRTFEALSDSANVQLPVLNNVPVISAGGQHSLVADRYGRVFSCGRDEGDGRLGLSVPALESTNTLSILHQLIKECSKLGSLGITRCCITSNVQVALPEPIVQVAAGGYASLALSASGKLYAWGSNGNGEQGSGQWAWSGYRANLVNQLSDGRVKQVAAGGFHGAAVTHDGVVFTWGMGRQGALGHGGTSNCLTPTRVHKLVGVAISQVCCGPTATAAVSQDGKVYVWGNNAHGMLGLGANFEGHQQVLEPEEVSGLQNVQSVALGAMHGLAVCT